MERTWHAYLAELLGTFAFVFVAAGAVCVNALAALAWSVPTQQTIVQPEPGLAGIALATGAIYAAALAATLPLSGGYLNPAVLVSLWVFKRLDTMRALLLIVMQLVGAALAGLALRLIFAFRLDLVAAVSLGTPHLSLGVFEMGRRSALAGVGIELVLTFILTLLIYALFVDPRAASWLGRNERRWACLWLGLAILAATMVGFPMTGAALNPARWFGTVLWEATVPSLQSRDPFRDHAVYWFGPISGALLAGLLYTVLILPAEETEAEPGKKPAAAEPPTRRADLRR